MSDDKAPKTIPVDLKSAYSAVRGNLLLFAGVLIGLNATAKDFESAAIMFEAIGDEQIQELINFIIERTNGVDSSEI